MIPNIFIAGTVMLFVGIAAGAIAAWHDRQCREGKFEIVFAIVFVSVTLMGAALILMLLSVKEVLQ
jgi:hypothetical protein